MSASSAWLRFLFGLDDGEVPSGADSHFELTGLWRGGAGWFAFLIITAAIVLIVALYRRERELTRVRRAALAALRLGALAIVIWMLLDPRILTELELKRPAHTFVVLDTSASMAQADPADGRERRGLERATGLSLDSPRSRAALSLAAIDHEKLIERLEEKNRVRAFTFDAGLKATEKLDGASFNPPGGDETRLGDALHGLLKQAGADPIAGIVVVTDGRSNAGDSLEKAAADLASRGVPVYAIGAGRQKEPKNYAVSQLSGPDVAIAGFPIRIEGRVEVSGIRGPVTVTLSRQLVKGGAKEKVEDRSVDGKNLTYSSSLVFVDTLPKNGTYRYTLSIPRHSEETDASDNQRAVQVTASDEKCRVLLVAGSGSLEYEFLSRFLTRDKGLQVSCWLTSADSGRPQDGDVTIRELPQTLEKLRPYDVVVLLDPDPRPLPAAFLQALKEFVLEQGGGVAYAAGECFWAQLFTSESFAPLRAILPIEKAAAEVVQTGRGRRAKYTTPWRPMLTRQGAEHPICRLADDSSENARVWSQVPPLFHNASVRALKPAAASLLEKEGGDVIVATQKAGAGYVVFIGTNDISRLWNCYRGAPERFWGSVVRYLALGKKVSGAGEVALYTDRDRYTSSEDIVFEANLTDPERKPVEKDRVEVSIELAEPTPQPGAPRGASTETKPSPSAAASGSGSGSGSTSIRLNLLPIAGRPGWYTGRFHAEKAGRYAAQVAGAPDPATGKASFVVVAPTSEWEDPSPDPAALEELARKTGGAYFPLEEIGQVPDRIGDRSVIEVIGRSASTVWDSSAVMLLFSALLIVEWSLRKLWRLN